MATRVKSPARRVARRERNYKLVARPTRWGNPYKIEEHGRERALSLYEAWLDRKLRSDPQFLEPLRGYNLGCFCPRGAACHADILLKRLYGE